MDPNSDKDSHQAGERVRSSWAILKTKPTNGIVFPGEPRPFAQEISGKTYKTHGSRRHGLNRIFQYLMKNSHSWVEVGAMARVNDNAKVSYGSIFVSNPGNACYYIEDLSIKVQGVVCMTKVIIGMYAYPARQLSFKCHGAPDTKASIMVEWTSNATARDAKYSSCLTQGSWPTCRRRLWSSKAPHTWSID